MSVPCGLGVIGSLVLWDEVPPGSLVRGERSGDWYVRIGDRGWCVNARDDGPSEWYAYMHWPDGTRDDDGWSWLPGGSALMQVAALGLKGDESAAALRGFADAFEQRYPWEGP